MQTYSWIRTELKRIYPKADMAKGVDLNKNGTLEANETITDANRNKTVGDAGDWQAFLKRNNTALRALPGIFKAGVFLKADNPIHDILAAERPLAKPADVTRVYALIKTVLAQLKKRIARDAKPPANPSGVPNSLLDAVCPTDSTRTNKGKLSAIYDILRDLKYTFDSTGKALLLSTTLARTKIDCDTSAFIVLAVAHEMKWPIKLVLIPRHAFLRWDDGKGTKFNFDQGNVESDAYYMKKYKIDPVAVKRGAHMKSLDRDELIGMVYINVATAYFEAKDRAKALAAAAQTMKLYPKGAVGYYYTASALASMGKLTEALPYIKKALHQNPRDAAAFFLRGKIKKSQGDAAGGKRDIAAARKINPHIGMKVVYR